MKKKSKYKPRPVRINAVEWVVEGVKPVLESGNNITMYRAKNHSAMTEILQGRGNLEQLSYLINSLNICEAYAIYGKGSDWRAEIREAQDYVYDMACNALDTNKFIFRGHEIKAINLAMQIHELQLEQSTTNEFDKMAAYVIEKIVSKKTRVIKSKERQSNAEQMLQT